MKFDELRLTILEEKYSMRILVALGELGPSPRRAIYEAVSNGSPTVMARLNSLIIEGLVKEEARQSLPFTKTIQLTEKGQKVAQILLKLERALETSESEKN